VEREFTASAPELRAVFDARFEDPRETTRERFLWDYWHVENQYTLHRTQVAGVRGALGRLITAGAS
jgi:hypothetical protein